MSANWFVFFASIFFAAYQWFSSPCSWLPPQSSGEPAPDPDDSDFAVGGTSMFGASNINAPPDHDPSRNVDGTPMLGAVDMNGNVYGITQNHVDMGHEFSCYDPFDSDRFEHTTNIDGTPMVGDIDIHGNTFGVTDWHSDSWGSGGMSLSLFD